MQSNIKLAISPIHSSDDFPEGLTIEDKIDIFVARIEGWQLGIAQALIENNVPHRGFALLHIVVSLFEMIGKYRAGFIGEGRSKYFFSGKVQNIFSNKTLQKMKIFSIRCISTFEMAYIT